MRAKLLGAAMSRPNFLHFCIAGGVMFALASTVYAGESSGVNGPAVSTVNGTLEAGGGEFADHGVYWGAGSESFPLGHSFGLQGDGFVGNIAGTTAFGGAGHLFWRDPSIGLIGLYGSDLHVNALGGVDVWKVGAEGEAYLGAVTFKANMGLERGDLSPNRFFDRATIVYYPSDNWNVYLGHRYTLGSHAGVLGAEYLLQDSNFAFFAQGRLGEHATSGFGAGLRLYIGVNDKSLEQRQREDDPEPDFIDVVSSVIASKPPAPGPCTTDIQCDPGLCITGRCV